MCHFCFNETLEYMKHIIKLMLVLLSMTAMTDSYAQKSDDVEKQVNELVKKYDGKQGITCMKVAKGSGLELLKMALKNEFGKSFLKGVTPSLTTAKLLKKHLWLCARIWMGSYLFCRSLISVKKNSFLRMTI